MSAEEAMRQIDQIMDEYIAATISHFQALSRIARVLGQHLGAK